MVTSVTVLDQARKDLKRMGKGAERARVLAGLERLTGEDAALDGKALRGSPGWLRLRIGNYRVLYRVVDDPEQGRVSVVQRVVHRRDLDAATDALPDV